MVLAFSLSGRVVPKKNSRISTRSGRTFPSKRYTTWHKSCLQQMNELEIPKDGIKKCKISVVIIFPDRIRADLDNRLTSVLDLLVDYGLIKDDSWDVVTEIRASGRYEKNKPGVDIIVEVDDE